MRRTGIGCLLYTSNDDAKKLYCDLDSELWKEVEQNPVLFLERIHSEKLVALAHDENFVYKMDAVYSAFKKYIEMCIRDSNIVSRLRKAGDSAILFMDAKLGERES